MVYVLNTRGEPLMPTERHGKVRRLLRDRKAVVAKTKPFTIRLLYESTEFKQPVTLGIDSGYTYMGFSAVSGNKELISGELTLLSGMSERLKEKAMYRRNRRGRLRYRAPRFNNRKRKEGWLAPSVQHKLYSQLRFIAKMGRIIPMDNVVVEVANFDTQKIMNPDIEGSEYQEGSTQGFWNLREYILHRDGHQCQNPQCSNRGKEKILQVHHIGFWKKDRSDREKNLITLCTRCHTPKNHKESGFLWGWKPKLRTLREATFMSTVRWQMVNTLGAEHTYGYQTKSRRIELGIEKSHRNDAFCIAGGGDHRRCTPTDFIQVKRNSRSLEKFYDAKFVDIRSGSRVSAGELPSGRRTRNRKIIHENLKIYRGEKLSKGRRQIRRKRYAYQPKDIVLYQGKAHRVKGVQNKGGYIKLEGVSKPVKIDLVAPKRYSKGLCAV